MPRRGCWGHSHPGALRCQEKVSELSEGLAQSVCSEARELLFPQSAVLRLRLQLAGLGAPTYLGDLGCREGSKFNRWQG